MRIASVPEKEATGKVAATYESVKRALGRVTPAFQAMSLKPDYLEGFWTLHTWVMGEGDLARREKEAIALAVSGANGCEYCVVAHSGRLRALGANEATVRILETDPDRAPVSPREAAILRFALKMTRSPAEVGDADVDVLRAVGLTDGAIFEAAAVAAHFNGLNRFLDALGVKPLRPR